MPGRCLYEIHPSCRGCPRQGPLAHGDKIRNVVAADIAPHGDSVLRSAKFRGRAKAGERAARRLGQMDFIPASGAKREAHRRSGIGIELVFVKHLESARRNDRVRGHLELAQSVLAIAQIPTADVHGSGAQVVQLDRIFEGLITVREHFVDDDVAERKEVRVSWRLRGREADDRRLAVRKAALGNTGSL